MKTKPIGIRFDEQKLEFLKKKENITSNQKVVDFLLDEYWKLFAPREMFQSKFYQPSDGNINTKATTTIAPPPVSMSAYEAYYAEIKFAKSVSEITATMAEAITDKSLTSGEKDSLKKYSQVRALEIDNS